jgi:hypothetical protein
LFNENENEEERGENPRHGCGNTKKYIIFLLFGLEEDTGYLSPSLKF